MPTQVQFRRGTSAQNNSFTGAAGELSIDSDNNTIRVHDGSTSGGHAVAKRDLSNINNVGIITATGLVVSGNVSIGGTLTYEDVSNVDSIGIITARKGIVVSSGGVVVTGIVTATDFNSTSDETLKKNIQIIENPISKLFEISGVTFNWIENEKASVGVIAQDVEKALPQLVSDMGSHKVVNYNGLIGLLVECIKHQQRQIDELKEHMIGS
jgi:hypothetical protein